jgi:hypothetical protein
LDASLKESIQEDLRLTLFVARDVFWHHEVNSASFTPSGMARR